MNPLRIKEDCGRHHSLRIRRCHFEDRRFHQTGRRLAFFGRCLRSFDHNLSSRRCKRPNELIHRNIGRCSLYLGQPSAMLRHLYSIIVLLEPLFTPLDHEDVTRLTEMAASVGGGELLKRLLNENDVTKSME